MERKQNNKNTLSRGVSGGEKIKPLQNSYNSLTSGKDHQHQLWTPFALTSTGQACPVWALPYATHRLRDLTQGAFPKRYGQAQSMSLNCLAGCVWRTCLMTGALVRYPVFIPFVGNWAAGSMVRTLRGLYLAGHMTVLAPRSLASHRWCSASLCGPGSRSDATSNSDFWKAEVFSLYEINLFSFMSHAIVSWLTHPCFTKSSIYFSHVFFYKL